MLIRRTVKNIPLTYEDKVDDKEEEKENYKEQNHEQNWAPKQRRKKRNEDDDKVWEDMNKQRYKRERVNL